MATMEVTMQIGCNLMCSFCPQKTLIKNYTSKLKSMTFENYVLYLSKIPKHVRIDFSGMSEPWLNKNATRILEHTLKNGYQLSVYTTLYGMTIEDAKSIVKLIKQYPDLVEGLTLHLPDAEGNMKGFKISNEYVGVLKIFLDFKKTKIVKNFNIMTMDKDGNYHKGIGKYLKQAEKWRAISRAGNINKVEPPKHSSSVYCAWTPYYDQNVLLPNGDIVLCCMDYSLKHVIGNLNVLDDYYELYSSDNINKIRVENQRPLFNSNSICKTCERATFYSRPISLKRQIKSALFKLLFNK